MDLTKVEAIWRARGQALSTSWKPFRISRRSFAICPKRRCSRVSEALDVPLIEVFRLANFYKAFSLKPRGRHLITVCEGTACHVQGSPRLVEEVLTQLEVEAGETTPDGAFTVETVNCVGACALAPVVIIDGQYHDHMTAGKLRDSSGVGSERQDQEEVRPMPKLQSLDALADLRQQLQADAAKYKSSVTMCAGTACQACGCLPVAKAMEAELAEQELTEKSVSARPVVTDSASRVRW